MIEDLRTNEVAAAWIDYLAQLGAPPFEVTFPPPAELPCVLRDLAITAEDGAEIVATLPAPDRSPEVWWVLERAVHSLTRHMGSVESPPWFPGLPAPVAERYPFLFVHVFLATLPHVRAYHRARGIPDEIALATLADLGRRVQDYRRAHGRGGFDLAFWLMLHFRGVIYQIGRLQFERGRLGRRTGAAVAAAGLPLTTGDPALAVHIPGESGPLSPEACDASFAQARAFFARYYPDERYEVAVCNSWLLDPQLREYLSEDSNILRFQRRFQLAYLPEPDTEWLFRFVFGRSDVALDQVPQQTSLERAVVSHLRSGRVWHGGAGWLRLEDV